MKYYHIIYNSSEKPMDGGVGFGIRTATEGTPDELLKAIKGIKFFTDDWESYENKPTPAKMKENPSSIESIAKNYAVTNITDEKGNAYYVIARRAYVGFDYGFYKNGMPTRPGNYVIDYYVFDSVPESSAYEILYEKALADSNHFIPKSVQPTEDNAEMKEISVGSQAALPISDKAFAAEVEDALDKDVVKLFFTYLKAQKEGKKLVVKTNKDKALKLTADLYRMLEPDSAKSVRTYINLRSQGVNDSFDIFFIHEDYPHQIYPELYDYMELDSASMPETDEAKTFGIDLENLVSSSFNANKEDVYDTLKWLLMPEYTIVKNLSKLTIDSFFCYCIQTGNFMYENLKDSNGKLNDEFLNVLCPYTKKNEKNAERFNMLVTEAMNDATTQNVIGLIQEYNHLLSVGFALDDITANVKSNICTQLLSDINFFKKSLDSLTLEGIEKFFVKSIFESKNDYVNSNVLDSYMLHLYKWFLTDEELSKKSNVLYNRFLKRDMDSKLFLELVDDVHGGNNDKKVDLFVRVLQNELKPFKTIWEYIKVYLPNLTKPTNFLESFKDRLDNKEYAPMFYYSIKEKKNSYSSVEEIEKLTDILYKNQTLKELVKANYADDSIYSQFYKTIYERADKDPKGNFIAIKDNILDLLGVKDDRFLNLAIYLKLIVDNNAPELKQINDSRLLSIYKIIVEKNNVTLYNHLLPRFKDLVSKSVLEPLDLVKSYNKFNNGCHCIDMLTALVSSKDQLDLMGAIVVGYCHKNFKDAFATIHEFKLDSANFERFMTKFYEKDYNSYRKKNKIKAFFKSIKDIFTKKDKDESEPKDTKKKAKKESSKK